MRVTMEAVAVPEVEPWSCSGCVFNVYDSVCALDDAIEQEQPHNCAVAGTIYAWRDENA